MSFENVTKNLYPRSYNRKIRIWLRNRYGYEADGIWDQVQQNYLNYFADLPDFGGKENGHAAAIYGGLLIFSLYPALPDQPLIADLQSFVQNLFMEPFVKLGKIFDLNRKLDIGLINMVFHHVGTRDRKDHQIWPAGFETENEPYDRKNRITRYRFTKCPNAEFAKQHDLLHVLPLLCNSDFFGISQIHGTLIRTGTCGNSCICDYCVVGDLNPLAQEYDIVSDNMGFLVSRKKIRNA